MTLLRLLAAVCLVGLTAAPAAAVTFEQCEIEHSLDRGALTLEVTFESLPSPDMPPRPAALSFKPGLQPGIGLAGVILLLLFAVLLRRWVWLAAPVAIVAVVVGLFAGDLLRAELRVKRAADGLRAAVAAGDLQPAWRHASALERTVEAPVVGHIFAWARPHVAPTSAPWLALHRLQVDDTLHWAALAAAELAVASGDADLATGLLERGLPRSPACERQASESRSFSLALHTVQAIAWHEDRPEHALDAGRSAADLAGGSGPASRNLCRLQGLPVLGQLEAGRPDLAVDLLEPLLASCTGVFDPTELGAVTEVAARALAQGVLVDPETADPAEAIRVLSFAHEALLDLEPANEAVACDLAGAWTVQALGLSRAGDLAGAVHSQANALALLDHPSVGVPLARLRTAWAAELLEEGIVPLAVEQLSLAVAEVDRAVEAEASEIAAWPEEVRPHGVLARLLMMNATDAMRDGRTLGIEADLTRAVELAPGFEAEAQLLMGSLVGRPGRLSRLSRVPAFVDLPEVVGELPEDLDGDGEADRLLYYRAGEAGAIVMAEVDARGRERLLLFEEPGSRKVAAMVRDLDGDSRYDDVTRFVDGSLAEIQIDQDRDGEPDFLQRFVDGREVHRESKAKKLGMRFRSAQIAQHDVQFGRFGVGRPDAYLQVHKNGELLFRTSAIHDTHFPTWNEGVAVDWRPGDRIDLLMWDQDRDVLWIENKDDFIDSMSIWDRPESGVYDFDRRRASMELRVEPTDRPEGYPLQSEAPPAENIFRDRPWMAPESRDVYLTANRMELQADVTDYLISEIGSQIIVRRILPRAGPTGWIASFAVQQLVFTPLVGEDGLSRSHRDPESGAVIPGQPPAE